MGQDAPRNDVDSDDGLWDFHSEAPNTALDKKEPDVAVNRNEPDAALDGSEPVVTFDSREQDVAIGSKEPDVAFGSKEPPDGAFRQKRQRHRDRFQPTRAGSHVRHNESAHSAGRARASPARTVLPAFCVQVSSRRSQERKAEHRQRAAHARDHWRLGMVGPFVDGNAPRRGHIGSATPKRLPTACDGAARGTDECLTTRARPATTRHRRARGDCDTVRAGHCDCEAIRGSKSECPRCTTG